jgi:nitrate reductase NapAB chaperone NapD
MSIYTSIIQIREEFAEEVRNFLQGIEGIDIHDTEDMSSQLLVTIDVSDDDIKDLCKRIQEHEGVVTILHHSIYFEEE